MLVTSDGICDIKAIKDCEWGRKQDHQPTDREARHHHLLGQVLVGVRDEVVSFNRCVLLDDPHDLLQPVDHLAGLAPGLGVVLAARRPLHLDRLRPDVHL